MSLKQSLLLVSIVYLVTLKYIFHFLTYIMSIERYYSMKAKGKIMADSVQRTFKQKVDDKDTLLTSSEIRDTNVIRRFFPETWLWSSSRAG